MHVKSSKRKLYEAMVGHPPVIPTIFDQVGTVFIFADRYQYGFIKHDETDEIFYFHMEDVDKEQYRNPTVHFEVISKMNFL